MSTIITYRVLEVTQPKRFAAADVGNEFPTGYGDTEDEALLAFKDNVTKAMPNENAMIFVTEQQREAMQGYSEMEKHGCRRCEEDPCQCCEVCKGPCQGH